MDKSKHLKIKDGNKDNKLMSFRTWTKIEDFKNTKLNALPVYDDRFIN